MKLKKLVMLSLLVLLSCGLCSCSPPPDIPGCTQYPSKDYFKMKELFLKFCYDDYSCKPNLDFWKNKFSLWTTPSEEGVCRNLVSGKMVEIKSGDKIDGETWPELLAKGIVLPAKQSVAPLKTYIQDQCHQSQRCNNIGKWEDTINGIEDDMNNAGNIK